MNKTIGGIGMSEKTAVQRPSMKEKYVEGQIVYVQEINKFGIDRGELKVRPYHVIRTTQQRAYIAIDKEDKDSSLWVAHKKRVIQQKYNHAKWMIVWESEEAFEAYLNKVKRYETLYQQADKALESLSLEQLKQWSGKEVLPKATPQDVRKRRPKIEKYEVGQVVYIETQNYFVDRDGRTPRAVAHRVVRTTTERAYLAAVEGDGKEAMWVKHGSRFIKSPLWGVTKILWKTEEDMKSHHAKKEERATLLIEKKNDLKALSLEELLVVCGE